MLGLIQSKAKQGDAEAIQTLKTLRSMGLIEDEPKAVRELAIWEIMDLAMEGKRKRQTEYRKRR